MSKIFKSDSNLFLTILVALISIFMTAGTVKLVFFPSYNEKDIKDIKIDSPKYKHQTKVYYEARDKKIDLNMVELDFNANTLKINFFNISPNRLILVVNNKIAVIDANLFIKNFLKDQKKSKISGFNWLIYKLLEIGKIMPFNVYFENSLEHLKVDYVEMSDIDFKKMLNEMLTYQII